MESQELHHINRPNTESVWTENIKLGVETHSNFNYVICHTI